MVLSACGDGPRNPISYGTATSIIVIAPDGVWSALEDTLRTVLEPQVFTVRDERAFEVTQVSPTEPRWGQLRLFRQVLVIGAAEDPWVEPVISKADGEPPSPPALVEADNVWSLGQHVSALVLPSDRRVEQEAVALLSTLEEGVARRFRSYVLERMYASGVDEGLQRRLARDRGFSLIVPRVYRVEESDSLLILRNDFPDPSRLVRSVLVTWRDARQGVPEPETLLAWRDTVAERHYSRPMETRRDPVRVDTLSAAEAAGAGGLEVHGIWQGPPGAFPGGGPFIARAIHCPEQGRTYLLDAWLYAPGRDKLEYVMQLQTILSTFRCGSAATTADA